MCAAILRGLHRLIWQLCQVYKRQLHPNMMQSQPHSTSAVPSLSFSFVPLTDVSSIFISHSHHPLCLCVHFSSFSLYTCFFNFFFLLLRYWNQCIPELLIAVNMRTCAHLCWFSSCRLCCRWTRCTCRTQMHFQCSAVESWREALYRAQRQTCSSRPTVDMMPNKCAFQKIFRQKSVFLYCCCPVTQDK